MASGFNHEPYSLPSSTAASVTTEENGNSSHSFSLHPSVASSVAGADGDDFYEVADLQIIFEIVKHAQEIYPELPVSSRLPTPALFAAYNEILPRHDIDPEDDQHLSRLVFKIGGTRTGGTLMEKFQAVMARMNITLELDAVVPQQPYQNDGSSDPSVNYSDGYYDHSMEDQTTGTMDFVPRQRHSFGSDGNGRPASRRGARVVSFEDDDDDDDDDPTGYKQDRLGNLAAAFGRQQTQLYALEDLQQWHARSSRIEALSAKFKHAETVDMLQNALSDWWNAANFEGNNRDVVFRQTVTFRNEQKVRLRLGGWWDEANVYAKGMDRISRRTNEIYSSKNALARWRRASRKHGQIAQRLPETTADEVEDDPRLARLAARTYDNLIKSRSLAQWSNRALDEVAKAQIAAKARDMGLKSRVLGVKPRLEALAEALRQRRRDAPIASQEAPIEVEQPSAPQPDVSKQQPSTVPPKSSEETTEAPEAPDESVIAELKDERALLARRHILRMRFFSAWLNYTAGYTTKSKDFALQKAFDAWQENSNELAEVVVQTTDGRRQNLAKDALHAWSDKLDSSNEMRTKADEAIQRTRISKALQPWMAASHDGRIKMERKNKVFWAWYDKPNREEELEICATEYHVYWRLSGVLACWRYAVKDAREKERQLQDYSSRADYYRSTSATLRLWLVKSREAARHTSMKADALKLWRHSEGLDRQKDLENYAHRTNLWMCSREALPLWLEAAGEAKDRHEQLEAYAARADYYYKSQEALTTWRSVAKDKRRQRLKEAHLETRRRVKKAMGSRVIAHWRDKLQSSYERYEIMNATLEEITADRGWESAIGALDIWRMRTQEKVDLDDMGDAMVKQKALDGWRERTADQHELRSDAEEHWKNKVATKTIKTWSRGSLQVESRRHLARSVLERRDRKLLRQSFEGWYGRTAEKLEPVQSPNGSYMSVDNLVDDAQQLASQSQARGLFSTWRAAANRQDVLAPLEDDEVSYTATPSRPQLLLGSLGRRQTTTPLGPLPSRQSWQRDSTPAQPTADGRAGRGSRSRRNLRVSWAE